MMQFRNQKYTAQGHIDCEVLVGGEWLPTTVARDDAGSGYDAAALFAAIEAAGGVEPYSAPERDLAAEVRAERDIRLAKTDWMALPDNPRCTPKLLAYRQALRDVPAQPGFPDAVIWPETEAPAEAPV